MYKALAVIRTLFLLFITIYTLVIAPAALWDSATATVTVESMRRLQRATWIAIAWIALETLIGWIVASFRTRKQPALGPATPSAPPAAPPAPRRP